MRKPKLKEYEARAQSHAASGQQGQELNPGASEASAHGFSPTPHTLYSRLEAPEKSVRT